MNWMRKERDKKGMGRERNSLRNEWDEKGMG
jgi:hypothetical protein